MKIATKPSNADRQRAFRQRHGDNYRAHNRQRMRASRASHIPKFVGVDSEGIGRGSNHRAVLVSCGKVSHIADDKRRGLHWKEVFQFLYSEFEKNPEDTVYVGFYLKYDFNEWLKSLPEKAARQLLTKEGKLARKAKGERSKFRHGLSYPVRADGWEFDMPAGWRCLAIRPRVCTCLEDRIKCVHEQKPFMYICDAGPFFQTSFLKVLEEWPEDDRLWTDKEYRTIEYGKNNLRTVTRFSKKMIEYNTLENDVLARIMVRVAEGLRDMGIKLSRDKWYGPGPVAATWLQKQDVLKNRDLIQISDEMNDWLEACQFSFYGGWFEIFSHGLIPGESYNYDINSAYPFATTKLPHICSACDTRRGIGKPKNRGKYMLLHCTVWTKGNRIGAMPHRDRHGSIVRPNVTKGWYWAHELDASTRANLVKKVEYHEWMEFVPCDHGDPFVSIGDLYSLRNVVGKNSPHGRAIKLVINSVYGKFAQSIGGKPFNNWFYASYITSHCRTQILDAIATHPDKSKAVLMVATDGICFDSRHPSLPSSPEKRLGEWDATVYEDLFLFKPGVYWDKNGKEQLKIKSRGVPSKEFAKGIDLIEQLFQMAIDNECVPGGYLKYVVEHSDLIDLYHEDIKGVEYYLGAYGWPQFIVKLPFHMTSCLQALQRNKWDMAGDMQDDVPMVQSSFPFIKREDVRLQKGIFNTFIKKLDPEDCETKYYKNGGYKLPRVKDTGFGIDGNAIDDIIEAASTARDTPRSMGYEIDPEDMEWVTVWDGGPVEGAF